MKTLTKIALTAVASLLLISNAIAMPVAGNVVRIHDGIGNFPGGEFKLDIGDDKTIDYFSFCVEYNEHVSMGNLYTIQSVEDYASNGGVGGATDGKDYLSDATKWVMWNYYNNAGIFYEKDRTANFATQVQKVIWALEDEILLSNTGLYAEVIRQGDYRITGGVIKVLNLVDSNGKPAQSQLVAAPVPEPTTMLLFGTGLIGLAGIARRRQNA